MSDVTVNTEGVTTATTSSGNANGPIPTKVNGNSDPKFYTQEDIEKAREQEKSKMYKRLETMQDTVNRLELEAKTRAEAEEAAQRILQSQQQEEEAATKKRQESEMSAKDLLAQKEQEWEQKLSQVQQQVEAERALRERETQFAELMDYRQQVVQAYSDRVAPELLDLIQGDTPEELQASAEDMTARTERILAQTAEAMQNQRQAMPTVRATAPASGENSGSQRSYTPDEIRTMSMAEYSKHRRSLLGGGTDGPKNRGLFG
jgi:hypothetical protein